MITSRQEGSQPIEVAVRSKEYVHGCEVLGSAGSNPVCLLCVVPKAFSETD